MLKPNFAFIYASAKLTQTLSEISVKTICSDYRKQKEEM